MGFGCSLRGESCSTQEERLPLSSSPGCHGWQGPHYSSLERWVSITPQVLSLLAQLAASTSSNPGSRSIGGQWTLHPLGMTEAVIKEMWREPFLSRHNWGMSLCESLSLIASVYPDVQVMLILYTEMVKWYFFSCLLFDFLSNWVHTCMYMTHVYMFKAQLKNHKTVTPNRNLVSLTWLQAQFKHWVDFFKECHLL